MKQFLAVILYSLFAVTMVCSIPVGNSNADVTCNLALKKSVRQSSTGYGGNAAHAVDDDTNGNYNANSVSHTNNDKEAWWEVDLGRTQNIREIIIWNRTDCCGERLSNFYLLVSERPFNSNSLVEALNNNSIRNYQYAGIAGSKVSIPFDTPGRYVRVQLRGTNYLSLAEVQVIGSESSEKATVLGLQALSPPDDPVIVANGNTGGVQSGPTHSTAFGIKAPHLVTYMFNYHYFNNGKPPGTITLRGEDGTIYGPWQAEGAAGQGNVPDAYWVVRPNIVLSPGIYSIIDSDPSTWSYNAESKGSGFFEIRGVKQSPQSVSQPVKMGREPGENPVPGILQQQLIEAVKIFRLEAIVAPVSTLKKYSSISALQNITDIENRLFTETPHEVGWKYYFATSTYTVVPLTEQTYRVLFYHPWSDTAIMTNWQYANKQFVMTHVELILGDYIRQYGQTPFEVQPLWERKSVTITPLLAVPLSAGETLGAFENIFPASVKVENNSPFAKQRRNFDNNITNKEIQISMLAAANLRFERGITALIRYEQDKNFEIYRDSTYLLLSNVKMGDFRALKVTIPQTSNETFDLIKSSNKEIGLFKVVSVLKAPSDCFVFLSHPADPNNILVLWFQTESGKFGLRQAHFINHIFSASYVSQLKELVSNVSQP
ncbi:MAG: discoidin domain-containing protein [Desulfuromonadaceae bacterium]|nr:discoidin domain-containing protein [Desulfuromonadaceae bacterium]